MIEKPNFYVLTGGPGVGKTTLLRALDAAGERVVEETHRAVIREQMDAGGAAVPWIDAKAYAVLTAARDIAIFDTLAEVQTRVFFDRGIMDSYGGVPPWPALEEAVRTRRYNRSVFLFPPWREIYETDLERRQDWAEAERTFEVIRATLKSLAYTPVIVPKASVEERLAFVLDQVSTNARSSTKSPGAASEPST